MRSFGVFSFTVMCLLAEVGQAQNDTTQRVMPDRVNSTEQQKKPYVILISIDGFRADYAKKFNARNLLRLSQQGVRAEYMLPSFPTLTFPNHYSIVTGLYPAHHGIVDNSFYDTGRQQKYEMHKDQLVLDSSWYGGTPLWVLAEQQRMLTASFYWVASDAAIKGVLPTFYYHFSGNIPVASRIRAVKNWLQLPEQRRPHLITFYFPEVDHAAHENGPDSREAEKAVTIIDEAIGAMSAMVDSLQLPVNFIVVSDHGMAAVDNEHPVPMPEELNDTSKYLVVGGSTLVHIYVKESRLILPLHHQLLAHANDMDIYLPEEIPLSWHYGKPDDWYNRIGDILLAARYPKILRLDNRKITKGKHGFDPTMKEMHATFLAWGPQFKQSISVGPFENVNIFPLVANLLGLPYSFPIDGKNTAAWKAMIR